MITSLFRASVDGAPSTAPSVRSTSAEAAKETAGARGCALAALRTSAFNCSAATLCGQGRWLCSPTTRAMRPPPVLRERQLALQPAVSQDQCHSECFMTCLNQKVYASCTSFVPPRLVGRR
ncbi:unnamed protein product [Prorocentrum cordatum]|uniref:Uncharacterized protein n=1 Tax=Prorocentrum cordatum TaxID=2364126 RepID=A0ABN9Y6G2_9DINO|nr:unnamed protein product [Polarella glacialis]